MSYEGDDELDELPDDDVVDEEEEAKMWTVTEDEDEPQHRDEEDYGAGL